MLTPIPARMLSQTASVSVPTQIDPWGAATASTSYTVQRVHLQNCSETRKTKDNTEVQLRSILFVDARISSPALDYWQLQQTAQSAGGLLSVTVDGDVYTVLTVDAVPDDTGRLHHWELGLV